MSGNDFDELFGRKGDKTSFAERARPVESPPLAAGEPKEETAGSGTYKPYGFLPSSGFTESCEVLWWMPGTQVAEGIAFQYRFLLRIGFFGDEQVRLFLTDCVVVIDGKNLRDLRKKLSRRLVTFIQCYNPLVWPEAPMTEPVIQRVEIFRTDSEAARQRIS